MGLRKGRRPYLSALAILLMLPVLTSCGSASSPANQVSSSPAYSSVSLTASTTTPAENASVVINASLSGYGSGIAVPTGTLSFTTDSNSTAANVAVSGASTSWTTAFATPGAHTVTAAYSGDSNYQPSMGTLHLNVPYATGTAPGNYTVTVTGTSGSLSHSVSVNLVVQ